MSPLPEYEQQWGVARGGTLGQQIANGWTGVVLEKWGCQ
jgi:hypothetical protein